VSHVTTIGLCHSYSGAMRVPLITRRRFLQGSVAVAGLGTLAGGGLPALRAQQPKVIRLGFLGPSFADTWDEALPEALRELGYIEGQNFTIEYRRAGGQLDRLPALADELVRLRVDAIITAGTNPARAAKAATSTIPIVMVFGSDPVGTGLVQSLARPGGNVTGFINLAPELGAKRLELLKEAIPAISRVAVLTNASAPTGPPQWKEAERAARLIGIQAQLIEVRSGDELSGAIEAAGPDGRGALLVVEDALFTIRRAELIDLATRARLPAIYANGEIVRSGGLMSYGPNFPDQYQRAAVYLDRIFKGAKPADLPVQQPSRFDFLVNLKAAQAIGLTIPDSVLTQATEVFQ